MGKYYVYEYAYPDNYSDVELAGTVFYVGKGQGDRIYQHISEARRGIQSCKCKIIRSILSQGLEPVRRRAYETDVEQDAYLYEWALINLIYGYEVLTNIHEGGSGDPAAKQGKYIAFSFHDETIARFNACRTEKSSLNASICKIISSQLSQPAIVATLRNNPEVEKLYHSGRRQHGIRVPLDLLPALEPITPVERSVFIEYLLLTEVSTLFS